MICTMGSVVVNDVTVRGCRARWGRQTIFPVYCGGHGGADAGRRGENEGQAIYTYSIPRSPCGMRSSGPNAPLEQISAHTWQLTLMKLRNALPPPCHA
jgi:hypothetical protein